MKKFEKLGRKLSKEEQKRIMGGDEGSGDCVQCAGFDGACGYGGAFSCWYRPGGGNAQRICEQIYSGCTTVYGTWGPCGGCIMN